MEEFDMHTEVNSQILTEREVAIAFNMGLQTAVYVLEKSEELSVEGRRILIEELRKQTTNSA